MLANDNGTMTSQINDKAAPTTADDTKQNLSQVPMEVLNLIDDGKNPDEFTKDVLNSCIAKNQVTKGKTDSFKGLRKHLLEELEQVFPDEVESYREIRANSAAKAKCLGQAQSTLPNGDLKVKQPEL
ncbi:mediator of RNA polymerase II transcription subunit 10b [Tripterygium wilfordii]|uniref:Mediator of RNA polymerase II transcription subunit 10 n=1 Tax=Tripterygium wilfordii TaxID=458696 RepID=A0A7J7DKL9_TRIWF|nr:mediator of RNA polymerase II transcription subunit 10b [Tripterygium wilfordii]